MSRAGRPSARRAALDEALSGMDGGPRLRAAVDALRSGSRDATIIVDNGSRGPSVIDTRNAPPGGWMLEGMLPTGAVAALADLDDPSPATLLENGFDVVILMHGRGTMTDAPVQMSVHWRPELVPGRQPPAPFWARWNGAEFARIDPLEAAA